MPIGYQPGAPFDPANAASKLPEPLQQAGGFLGSPAQQAVGGDDPASQLMSPTPLMAGGTELGPLAKMLVKKITSTAHPAVSELLWLLGNYGEKNPNQDEALTKALSSRVTPSSFKPPADPIKLPPAVSLPGYTPYKIGGSRTMWYPPEAKFAHPPVVSMKVTPRMGSGAESPGALKRLANLGLTEDLVRKIKAVGDPYEAVKKFPDVKPGTIMGILKDGSFGWVK